MSDANKEYQKVIEYVISEIKANRLSVGDRLPTERSFASTLNISRNSTREGLRVLEHLGVIESKQGSGNYISGDLDKAISPILDVMMHLRMFDKGELFDFRMNMDKMVCFMLIDQNENLEKIANKAERILRKQMKNQQEEREQDVKFHLSLIQATGNRMLIAIVNSAANVFAEMIDSVRSAMDEDLTQKLNQAHFNIVHAIRSGDKEECATAIEYHYKLVNEVIKKTHLEEYRAVHGFDLKNALSRDQDELTGLYQKDIFFEKVEQYRKENPEQELLIWTADVQGLRFINERYGTEIGDKVLVEIAKYGSARQGFLFGSRVDGDKLVALMKDYHANYEDVNQILLKDLIAKLPIRNVIIKNGIYHVKKNDELNAEAMYGRAFMALLNIKKSYTRMIQEYDDSMRDEIIGTMRMEEDADNALINGEFRVYLQPKIHVSTKKVAGAEALIRWMHPEMGFMNPGLFVPVFENNGFIAKVDLWMWESVCKMLVSWREKGIQPVPISVNLSRSSFQDVELAEKIIEIVDRYGIDHGLLEAEVTEYACLDDMDRVQQTISKLHSAGFAISLDDFGTGYSSMVVISRLEIDYLKLDMSLIQNDNPDAKRSALEFALQLAKMMQLKTIAEGIETKEQVERISDLGADYIQGYYYSRPLPQADFETFLVKFRNCSGQGEAFTAEPV